METIVVHPKSRKQMETIEAILKALDVSFKKEEKDTYSPEFVAKIKESERQIKEGKFTMLDPNKSLWENISNLIRPGKKGYFRNTEIRRQIVY